MNADFQDFMMWRRGRDSNTQHLSVHYISNVAPYQLEYLSNWQYSHPVKSG